MKADLIADWRARVGPKEVAPTLSVVLFSSPAVATQRGIQARIHAYGTPGAMPVANLAESGPGVVDTQSDPPRGSGGVGGARV